MQQFIFGYTSSIELLDALGNSAEQGALLRGMRPEQFLGVQAWSFLALPHDARDSGLPHPIDCLPLPAHALVAKGVKTRPTAAIVPHEWTCPLALDDLVRLPWDERPTYACPAELALVQFASMGGGRASIASLANQLTGTYRVIRREAVGLYQSIPGVHVSLYPRGATAESCQSATVYGLPPLTTGGRIRDYVDALPGARGVRQLRRALPLLCDGLASPLEERIYLLGFCSRRMGSLGLPKPLVNSSLELSPAARRFVRRDHIVPDFYWPEACVALEANGWLYHGRPDDIVDTSLRDKAFRSMGITCITLTDAEVRSPARFDAAMSELAGMLGVGLPTETEAFRRQKAKLRTGVLGWGSEKARGRPSVEMPGTEQDEGYLRQLDEYADMLAR